MSDTMRAIGFRRYGPPEVLEPLGLPIPSLGPNTVRIRVAAASINPADWRFRSGQFRFAIRLVLPLLEPAETKQSRSLSTQSQITLAKIGLGRP